MTNLRLKALLGATALTMLAAGAAQAGGFSRGTADTDILFEEGNFNLRTGVTIVNPSRKYTSNPSAPHLVGTDPFETYVIPSAAVKFKIFDNLNCAGTYTQPFGGSGAWEFPGTLTGKVKEEFVVNEFGATCGVNFDMGKGRLWVLGGVFAENFDYERANVTLLGPIDLTLNGTDVGYRVGLAYDITEIALRAQVMYRSGTSYGADGTLTGPAGVLAPALPIPPATQISVPVLGIGEVPQSVEMKLQSGIAPGWLAYGSVKWTDWSVNKTLDVVRTNGAIISRNEYYWKDGWTVTGGVAHSFTDRIAGTVSLTWDRGVGTGYDHSSDTYTLGVGGSFKDQWGGELRAGVGLSYLTSAEETKYPSPYNPALNSAVDSGWATAVTASYKVKW
ncbi:outer membrane protein transport protein [Mesorhizobium sp. CC13]|uniref:OmpP1/FadL family transporter n=1 Tax=Mesorhizobium sp. CC13 TaxID=3029194 RepID=UPI003262E77C